jgi:hypothetical protein
MSKTDHIFIARLQCGIVKGVCGSSGEGVNGMNVIGDNSHDDRG